MHALIPLPADATPIGALVPHEDLKTARAFAEHEKAASSRRAYDSDWRIFRGWCAHRDLQPLPASPQAVAAFIASEAQAGRKAATITRRLAAIRYAHRLAGHEPPTNAEAVKATMRGIRRTIGIAPAKKAPATHDLIAAMLATCRTDDLRGIRDRALLAFGFASAMRRSELVALQVEDLTETPEGYRVVIRRSKTDQEGQGQVIAIPTGSRLRPVEAVRCWLEAAAVTAGPMFRRIDAQGRVTDPRWARTASPCALSAGRCPPGSIRPASPGTRCARASSRRPRDTAPASGSSPISRATARWTRCAATCVTGSFSRTTRARRSCNLVSAP